MELYKENIEALKEVNPDLAKYIDNCKKPDWISDVKSENKSLNFVVKDGSKQTTGHDPKNPEKEVSGLIKKVKYYKDNSAVIVGMGYGYLPIAILKKAENSHKLIVVEPEPYFVKKSFELHDFSKYLLNNDLFIATPTKLEVDIIVNMINSAKVVSNWMVMISSYIALKKDVYHEISEHTAKMLNQLHCNTGTVSGAGKQIAQNDIESLPFIIKHRGVKDLYGLYKGKPAVIVSTGPSSWKNIYQLKEIQDKVIIICVAQALRMLLAYGIKPDFACTVDFGEVNESHFDGIMDCGIPLVALNRTYAPILQKYEGKKFIVGTVLADGFENSSSAVIQRKGSLEQGGSVAHLALGLAYALGCDNIALTGQDLSYPDKESHNKNADSSGYVSVTEQGELRWFVTDPKSTLYGESYSMGPAHFVDGYWGATVITNLGLASFIHSFESIIARNRKKVFNCTEGGAKLKNVDQLVLKSYIKKFCKRNINKKKIKQLSNFDPNYENDMDDAIKAMTQEIKDYDGVISSADKGITVAIKMRKATGAKLKRLFAENEKHSMVAQKLAQANPLLNVSIFKESREIASRKLNTDGSVKHLTKSAKDFNIRVRRNKLILKAAKRESENLKKITEQSLHYLEEYKKGNNLLSEKSEYVPNLEHSDEYLEKGNFARPLLDARRSNRIQARSIVFRAEILRDKEIKKAIEYQKVDRSKDLEYNDLIDESRKLGREANKTDDKKLLKKVEKILTKAYKLNPKGEDATWGLATVKHHLDKIDESLKLFKELVEANSESLSLKFEYASVLIRKDVQQALDLFSEVMSKTDQYNWFLSRIGDMNIMLKDGKRAIFAYNKYLDIYPADIKTWERLKQAYIIVDDSNGADICDKKLKKLKV